LNGTTIIRVFKLNRQATSQIRSQWLKMAGASQNHIAHWICKCPQTAVETSIATTRFVWPVKKVHPWCLGHVPYARYGSQINSNYIFLALRGNYTPAPIDLFSERTSQNGERHDGIDGGMHHHLFPQNTWIQTPYRWDLNGSIWSVVNE
jgi:hypothetical protein